ncbi:MAG TPA: hypothetical protein VJ372_13565 [Pyrinomonadaceae bacterium]|jgi:Zn-dependent protease with chaperone function|nr:hypothetical protein [Pyrinomonadaceae bacterium]
MSRKLALITVLSLLVTHTTTAAPDIVDLALQSIGTGSVIEMKSRILGLPFSVCGAEDHRQAIASLSPLIRESRVSGGKLLRRVENIIRPVLELHGRSDDIELFLYQDKFPQAMVRRGCVLVISDALAAPLHDDELAGIVAHEMGHAYFMIETINARKHGDRQTTRIVELKCDAVAMLSLKLLGHDPADHLRGLRRVDDLTRTNGYNTLDRDHPSIGERARFAQSFIKLL